MTQFRFPLLGAANFAMAATPLLALVAAAYAHALPLF